MAARMHDTTAVVPPSKRVYHPPYRSVPTQGYSSRKELPWWQRITRTGSLAMSFPDTLRQTGSAENINGHALTYRGIRNMKHKNSQADGMRRSSSLHDLPTSRPDDDAAFVALGRNFRSRSRESLVGSSYLPPGPGASAPLHAPQPQRPVSVCCFADSVVCNANSTDSTAACVVVCDRPHKPRTLFEALANPDPPTPKVRHDHYMQLASVPKLRTVDHYAGEAPTPTPTPTGDSRRPGRVTKLNGLTLTNTVANKARFWEAQSKGAGTVAPAGGRTVRNAPTKAVTVVPHREHSPPRSPPSSQTSPLLHAPRLAPAPLPTSAPLTFTTSLHSVGQDSSTFSAHGRTSAMAGPPAPLSLSRSWRSSERSPSPPPVWNSADPLWQSQPRSPTSSLLLNGRSKNETDEYKVSAPVGGNRIEWWY